MTKQRPASLNGSLLVKKGQAQPSVTASTDPVSKKTSRFPVPESVAELPLVHTPPIGDLYGRPKDKDVDKSPPEVETPKAGGTSVIIPSTAGEDQEGLAAPEEDTGPAPEPRLVFLLPALSWRLLLSVLLASVMGLSAWYLMSTSENGGTQRLASVGPIEEAGPAGAAETAGAISPPPSGINTSPKASANTSKSTMKPSDFEAEAEASGGATLKASLKAPVPTAKPKAASTSFASTGSNASRYAIQLLATKSAEAGRQAWTRISRKHNGQLGGLSLDLQTVTLQGRGKFVRVRAGPITGKQAAVNRCKALSSAGQDCLVVKF